MWSRSSNKIRIDKRWKDELNKQNSKCFFLNSSASFVSRYVRPTECPLVYMFIRPYVVLKIFFSHTNFSFWPSLVSVFFSLFKFFPVLSGQISFLNLSLSRKNCIEYCVREAAKKYFLVAWPLWGEGVKAGPIRKRTFLEAREKKISH